MTHPQLGKEIGIGGDLNGCSAAGREPLAVGGREVSVAHRDEKVDTRSDGGKYELATPARPRSERVTRDAAGLRHLVKADNSPCERAAGRLLQHDSLDSPSADTSGGNKVGNEAVHTGMTAGECGAWNKWVGSQSWLSGWACGPRIVMKTNPLTVQITPRVSAGTGCGQNRPLADAWGYLAASRDRMRNRFSTVQPPFEAAPRSKMETDRVFTKTKTFLTSKEAA